MKISKYGVGSIGALSLISGAMAQSYQAVELSGPSSWAFAGYNGQGGGSIGPSTSTVGHATIWNALGVSTDVHPAFFESSTELNYSQVNGIFGTLMAGTGRGAGTNGRLVAVVWKSGVPSIIPVPNGVNNWLAQAYATDGQQVVGEFVPYDIGTTPGNSHAYVYNAATDTVTDLYNGNPCVAQDVKGGQQVGYEIKGITEARLWSGSARNFVNLHPKGYVISMANALDAGRQVGYAGIEVNRVGEAKRGRKVRYDFACVWSGSAASIQFLSSAYGNSFATDIDGLRICGDGVITTGLNGTRGARHALVWDTPTSDAIVLHDLLPAGFTNSFANSIDAAGNVYGSALDANGKSHAIKWVRL